MYEAMARRYRPKGFADVIGQEHVARTLRNAITADRIAHAYLFCGPHGCGKTSMARIFARALVCEKGTTTEPCGECALCQDVMRGQDTDVQEIDGASNNGVEQVRALREQAGYVPTRARLKIYIIDEVHMLSTAAFNALLKTLEEPPAHVKFILATTDPHKIIDTVLSRCQRFDFRLVPPPTLAAFLKTLVEAENASITEEGVEAVAAFSGGSVRDGLVLLDQLLSFSVGEVTREDVERVRGVASAEAVAGLFEAIQAHDIIKALALVDAVAQRGTNIGDFLDQLISFGRDLMLMVVRKSAEGTSAYGPARATLDRLALTVSLDHALLLLDIFTEARTRVRSRALTNPLVPLEMAVARLAGLDNLEPVGKMMQTLDALARGAPPPGSTSVAATTAPAAPAPTPVPKPAPTVGGTNSHTPDASATASVPAEKKNTEQRIPNEPPTTEPERKREVNDVKPNETPAVAAKNPVATASTAPLTMTEKWAAVQEKIRAVRESDLGYLKDVYPREMSAEAMVLSVPRGGMILEKLNESERLARIVTATKAILGEAVTVSFSQRSESAREAAPESDKLNESRKPPRPADASSVGRANREALQDETVKKIIADFQGRVMNVEEDK